MPKNRIIVVLGVLVALLPVLGFPRSWEAFFQVLAGLSIVVLSFWATIDKKIMLKAKARERIARKNGQRVTDFYPNTAPPGRRISDINPTLNEEEQES